MPSLSKALPNIIIVDDFYADPGEVRNLALKQTYARDDRYHKVARSEAKFLFPGVKERFETLLGATITDWGEQPVNGVFQLSLAGDQQVFHSDAQDYAAVVYLTPDAPPESGTLLLRSRRNKLRCQEEAYARGMDQRLATNQIYGMSGAHLLDATKWEVVDVIGNRFNRCAIWHSRLAHSGGAYFGTTLEDGRLAHMMFFSVSREAS